MTTPVAENPYTTSEAPGGAHASIAVREERRPSAGGLAPTASATRTKEAGTAGVNGVPVPSERVELFGIQIDRVTREQSVSQILRWIDAGPSPLGCRYVLTPNVDHVVMLQSNAALRAAYAEASLVVADGWPVVRASRLLGKPLPERVAGSDLVPSLLSAATSRGGLRVFLLGGMRGVPERAAARIEAGWEGVEVVGVSSPNYGFENRPLECDRLCDLVSEAEPDLLIVGFGAPKQELWLHAHRNRLRAGAVIAAGATIDFLAGEQKRAPRWVQSIGMEWLFRAASDPRRLAGRYARDIIKFPKLCLREAFSGGSKDRQAE